VLGPIEFAEPMLELIGFTYEAAQDAALWPDLACRIAAAFDAAGAALVEMADGHPRILVKTPDIDADWVHEYQSQYPRLASDGCGRLPRFGFADASEPAHPLSEIRQWSCDSQIRNGASYRAIGTLLPLPSGDSAIFGMHRHGVAPAFDGSDEMRLAQFLPHLRNALHVRERLDRPPVDVWGRLDQAGAAVVAVARDARILRKNAAAQQLLNLRDGIHAVHGRLSGSTRPDTERLRATIARVIDGGERGVDIANALLLPREGGPPLTVSVGLLSSQPGDLSDRQHVAVLFFADPDERPLARGAFQSLFGLTPAEAAVANELSMGKTPDEIAACLGIRPGTVRAHLKSIYAKSGTKRQAEFVALLFRSLAALACHPLANFG
jgi:DNA-binding CsgD family transcriptional regulator